MNTEPQCQAARNLERDPRVTVLVRDEKTYDGPSRAVGWSSGTDRVVVPRR